jgi:hypothetical protein
MTRRERQIYEVLNKLGGEAHPQHIAKKMAITSDYAEILCREMAVRGHFVKNVLKYAIKK